MNTKVVGVTFSNDDGSSRERIIANMTKFDRVIIERDPMNQYDSNAVKVCVVKDGKNLQIGFVERNLAAQISPKLRRGANYKVSVVDCGIYMSRPYCEINIEEVATANVQQPTNTSTRTTSRPSSRPQQPNASAAPQVPKQMTTSAPVQQSINQSMRSNTPDSRTATQATTHNPKPHIQQPVKKEKKGFFSKIAAFFKGE